MVNRKPPRSEEDIAALAARWREGPSGYRDGVPMAAFLRSQLQRFETLISTGWSWHDVARSLDAAGIKYKTGNSWRPEILNAKVWQLQKQARGKGEAAALVTNASDEAYRLVKRAVVEALEAKGLGKDVSELERATAEALGTRTAQRALDLAPPPQSSPPEPSASPPVPGEKIIGLKQAEEGEADKDLSPISASLVEDQDRADAVLARRAARRTDKGGGH